MIGVVGAPKRVTTLSTHCAVITREIHALPSGALEMVSAPALVLGEMQSHATAGTASLVHLAAVPQRAEEGSAVANGSSRRRGGCKDLRGGPLIMVLDGVVRVAARMIFDKSERRSCRGSALCYYAVSVSSAAVGLRLCLPVGAGFVGASSMGACLVAAAFAASAAAAASAMARCCRAMTSASVTTFDLPPGITVKG
jgi:hypothetical protein